MFVWDKAVNFELLQCLITKVINAILFISKVAREVASMEFIHVHIDANCFYLGCAVLCLLSVIQIMSQQWKDDMKYMISMEFIAQNYRPGFLTSVFCLLFLDDWHQDQATWGCHPCYNILHFHSLQTPDYEGNSSPPVHRKHSSSPSFDERIFEFCSQSNSF